MTEFLTLTDKNIDPCSAFSKSGLALRVTQLVDFE
jgi:hypothetical protein